MLGLGVSRSKRMRRRGYPIKAFTGPNGSGKSALAVLDCVPSLRAGRPVLSTVRLLDGDNPRRCEGCELCRVGGVSVLDEAGRLPGATTEHRQAHPCWIAWTEWRQLLDLEFGDALADEVTGIASSRESHGMPPAVANTLVQMRRRDVVFRWTAPNWSRADKIIRECSQAVTYSRGFAPKAHRDQHRAWRNRRLTWARTYDAALFEDFSAGKREQLQPLIKDWIWLPGSGVFDWYDSFDSVLTIGTVSEGGTCERCGGSRRRPQCRCEPSAHGTDDGGPARSVGTSPARGRRIARPATTTSTTSDTPAPVRASAGTR